MDMNRIREFLSRTGLGSFLVWVCAAVLFLVAVAVPPFLGKANVAVGVAAVAVGVAATVFLAATSIWYAVMLFVTLAKRQWKKSAIMFVSGCVGACLLAVGFGFAVMHNFRSAVENWEKGKEKPRLADVPGEDGKTAFSVEYVNAHPFLAEYDKTIVFKSGKRIGVWMDTGGAGPFAVYSLPTGEYYLVDGLEHDFIRNDYRVNVTNETVEMMCDETWVNIPDKTLKVDGRSSDSISIKTESGEQDVSGGTPVGDSLKSRSYIGLLHPSGRFESGEGDPFSDIIEPKWEIIKLDGGEVPFSLECKRWKGSHCYRLAFASGARIALGSENCIGEGGYSLYALEDGRYHLFTAGQEDILWRNEWRIDATEESVEVMFKDHWNKYGNLWVKIPRGATSANSGIGISGGEDGKPLSVSIDVNTEGGKVTGHDFTPVGETLANEKFLGTFHPPDDNPRSKSHKRERKSAK